MSSVTLSVCLAPSVSSVIDGVYPVQLLLLPFSPPGQTSKTDEELKLLFKLPQNHVDPPDSPQTITTFYIANIKSDGEAFTPAVTVASKIDEMSSDSAKELNSRVTISLYHTIQY